MPALRLTPGAHRLLVRTLADGVAFADRRADEQVIDAHARDCRELLRLVVRRKPPKKALPEPTRKAKATAKRAARNEKWAAIREAVMKRAGGLCEACGSPDTPWRPIEAHHTVSGSGRRRQQESIDTVKALCVICHRDIHGERIAETR